MFFPIFSWQGLKTFLWRIVLWRTFNSWRITTILFRVIFACCLGSLLYLRRTLILLILWLRNRRRFLFEYISIHAGENFLSLIFKLSSQRLIIMTHHFCAFYRVLLRGMRVISQRYVDLIMIFINFSFLLCLIFFWIDPWVNNRMIRSLIIFLTFRWCIMVRSLSYSLFTFLW